LSIIRKNIGANYLGQFWNIIAVFLFVPFYIKFLGIEAYGLVGFYITLMGILAFADIGLTATLNRELARLAACNNPVSEMSDLLRTYELIYGGIALFLASLMWVLAPGIANHWLQLNTFTSGDVTLVIRIMGIAIALQLPANLYIGGLMGLQKQVLSNSIQIAWSVLRGGGSVLMLWLVSPTILAFIGWQLVSNIIYFLLARINIWRSIGSREIEPSFKKSVIKKTWRFAFGMAGISFISIALLQLDKLAVSKLLPLEMLGYYMLAATVASIPSLLAGPIIKAVFPRFTKLVEAGDYESTVTLYHRTSEFIALAIIPTGMVGIAFSGELIFIWTGVAEASRQAGMVASLLLAGALMQSMTVVAFHVALAHGYVRLNLKVGIASIILLLPMLFLLIPVYGINGAGISWLVMNVCIFIPYMYFLHSRFLQGEFMRWCLWSVGRPLFIALPLVLLGDWLVPQTDSRFLMFFLIGLIWAVTTSVAAIFTSLSLKYTLKNYFTTLWEPLRKY
jgi:O-antigen/teichoic acid export membrane protein